jgi:hypothetical protein
MSYLFQSHILLLSPCSENRSGVAKLFEAIDAAEKSTHGVTNFIVRHVGELREVK